MDENLERLKARHEALAENVEMLLATARETTETARENTRNATIINEGIERLRARHEALAESVEMLLATTREHTRQLEMDGEHIRALVRVAEMHERRITDIEGGPPQ